MVLSRRQRMTCQTMGKVISLYFIEP